MENLEAVTHISWFEGLKHSDSQIIDCLVKNIRPLVISRLRRQGADEPEAEDAFMDIVEAIFRKVRKLEQPFFDDRKFEAYFLQACQWRWNKKYRKKSFHTQVTNEELEVLFSDKDIEKELIEAEQAALFWEVFQALGSGCQKVLRLFLIEERSHQEIAAQMDYSYQYAKKKKYKCYQKLIERIKSNPLYKELTNY